MIKQKRQTDILTDKLKSELERVNLIKCGLKNPDLFEVLPSAQT